MKVFARALLGGVFTLYLGLGLGLGCNGGGNARPSATGGAGGSGGSGSGGVGTGGAGNGTGGMTALDAGSEAAGTGGAPGTGGATGTGGALDAGAADVNVDAGADGGGSETRTLPDFRIRVGSQLPGGNTYPVWVDFGDPQLAALPLDLTLSDSSAGTLAIGALQTAATLGDYGDWFQSDTPFGSFTVCTPGQDPGCPAEVTIDLRRGPRGAPLASVEVTIVAADPDPLSMASCQDVGNVAAYTDSTSRTVVGMGTWDGGFTKAFNQSYDLLEISLGLSSLDPTSRFDFQSPNLVVGTAVAVTNSQITIIDPGYLCSGSYVVHQMDLASDPIPATQVAVTRVQVSWSLTCNLPAGARAEYGCLDYDRSRPNPSRIVTVMF